MNSDLPQPIYECLVQFNDCSRYAAHGRIDDALLQFSRHESRSWHPSIVAVGVNRFSGAIRTCDKSVVNALHQATWRELQVAKPQEDVKCLVEITPKKPYQFNAFRSPEFAGEYLRERLAKCGAFEYFEFTYLASSLIEVRKPSCPYSAPSAWFEVTGRVKSSLALQDLILQGIGGSHSFGVGLFTPESSSFFATARLSSQLAMAGEACVL